MWGYCLRAARSCSCWVLLLFWCSLLLHRFVCGALLDSVSPVLARNKRGDARREAAEVRPRRWVERRLRFGGPLHGQRGASPLLLRLCR